MRNIQKQCGLKYNRKKFLSLLVSGFFFFSQTVFPSMAWMAEPDSSLYEGKDVTDSMRVTDEQKNITGNLLKKVPEEDLSVLKKYYTGNVAENFLPMNVLSKDYQLTVYETLILSDSIKKDVLKKARTPQERTIISKEISELQKKYETEYKEVFQKEVSNQVDSEKDTKNQIPKAEPSTKPSQNQSIASKGNIENIVPQAPSSGFNLDDYQNMPDMLSADGSPYQKNASPSYIPSSSNSTYEKDMSKAYQEQLNNANTPEEYIDSLSLVNINPNKANGSQYPIEKQNEPDSENPLSEFERSNAMKKMSPSENNTSGGGINFLAKEAQSDNFENRSLKELVSAEADSRIKEAKKYFFSIYHNLYYVKEKGEGNIPMDTNYKDATGKYYQPVVTDQYQLEESLEFGFGFRLHKALDLILGVEVVNDNGSIFSKGATWKFSNVMFDFHPERLRGPELEKLKKMNGELEAEGIIVRDNGRFIGKRLGHSTVIGTDTTTGQSAIQIKDGGTQVAYSQQDGFELSSYKGRYFLGIGSMDLSLSSYTLQLTDCKAIQAGYVDRDQSVLFLYGKPRSKKEGYTENQEEVPGIYNRYIMAAQYTSKKLFPFMDVAFNFAQSKDSGHLDNPNGATPKKSTVYSLVVQSKKTGNTSFQGEFARSINIYDTSSGNSEKVKGNADYFDITHRFSNKLNGTLHLVNIDGTYDASSMVEDRTGDNLLTTNKGNGLPDYIYETGQRGFELGLTYKPNDTTAFAFGWERYSKTTTLDDNGNPVGKTGLFLSGTKGWEIKNSKGETVGEVNLQQRFEANKASTQEVYEKISDTTLSYDGSPWKGGDVQATVQKEFNNYDGDQYRVNVEIAHPLYPLKRLTVTPRMQFSKKEGHAGLKADSSEFNSTTLINSLTIGYELIPDELTVNLMISKEKYDVLASEIDNSTGAKVDGEKRDILGAGIGLAWEPKKIPGLSMGVSYRKDKVHYYTPQNEMSHQDVWEYSLAYDRALSDKIRASISYNYRSAKDKIKPIYDEVTRTIAIDINANIAENQKITIRHEYEKEYKPLDASANHTTQTTLIQMTNKF